MSGVKSRSSIVLVPLTVSGWIWAPPLKAVPETS
jgi:hypothetical protein